MKKNKIYELERIRKQFNAGENPTKLMNEMEKIFKIPLIEDEKYNQENQDIIKLYNELATSRNL